MQAKAVFTNHLIELLKRLLAEGQDGAISLESHLVAALLIELREKGGATKWYGVDDRGMLGFASSMMILYAENPRAVFELHFQTSDTSWPNANLTLAESRDRVFQAASGFDCPVFNAGLGTQEGGAHFGHQVACLLHRNETFIMY